MTCCFPSTPPTSPPRTLASGGLLLVLVLMVMTAGLGCPNQHYEPIAFEVPETEPVRVGGVEDEEFVLERERSVSVVVGFLRALREEDEATLFSLVAPGSPLDRQLAPLREASEPELRAIFFAHWRALIGAHRGVQRVPGTGGSSAVTLPPDSQTTYTVRFELERDGDIFSLGSVTPQYDGFASAEEASQRSEHELWDPLPEWHAAAAAPPSHDLAEQLLAALEEGAPRRLLAGPTAYSATIYEAMGGDDYASWRRNLQEELDQLAQLIEQARFAGAYELRRYRLAPEAQGVAACRCELALCFESDERRIFVRAVYGTDTHGQWHLLSLKDLERPRRWPSVAQDRIAAYREAAAAAAEDDNGSDNDNGDE